MKIITLILILISFSCSKKKEQENISNNFIKTTTQKDSINLNRIFNSAIEYKNESTILFKKKVICKITKINNISETIIKPLNCETDINLFIDDKFILLKTNNWFEEALPHKDLYYSKDNYIIIFDMLKYCNSEITDTLFIETIRVYDKNDYYIKANKSNSIKYILKNK